MSSSNRQHDDERLAAAKQEGTRRLVTKLADAHRAGTLKPINPDAKAVTLVTDAPSGETTRLLDGQ